MTLITEQWLVESGFEPFGNLNLRYFFNKNKLVKFSFGNYGIPDHILRGNPYIEMEDGQRIYSKRLRYKEILESIYFALTGNELITVKE
jgi:hypothetical protein